MSGNVEKSFGHLIKQLSMGKQYEKAMARGVQRYQMSIFKIENLTPDKIAEMYYLITTKFYFNRAGETSDAWYQNQLRVFVYLLVGYQHLENKHIQNFENHDWRFFARIFNGRDFLFFQFQALSLLKRSSKYNKWNHDEVALLDHIIKARSIKNRWNQIARELFLRSNTQFFKTGKQCREYWINHLDPAPIRTPWTSLEDLSLIRGIEKFGRKWAKVSKFLGGKRTEHMVKNRFKSLYNFQEKQRQKNGKKEMQEGEIIQVLLRRCQLSASQEGKLQQACNTKRIVKREEQEEEGADERNEQYFDKVLSRQSTQLQIQPAEREMESKGYSLEENEKYEVKEENFFLQECISAYFNNDSIVEGPLMY